MFDNMAYYSVLVIAGLITACLFIFGLVCLIAFFLNIFRLIMGRFNRKLERCHSCGNTISTSAIVCPHCGHHYGKSKGALNTILGSLFGAILCTGGGFVALAELVNLFNDK
ncbi:zinc ribbon domain-containing protein [Paenibacillus sp. JJ-223]|uniref:zinc ribbon domain-containing protein n=1 Tax=Paenibacillus sp. JJ-223 TaxID=2905647 RepID=UPI001F2548B1|nr:zinc ribbon domain-containing protein [Paenibacillus sp. JJ-223]CAH1216201.1 hypothetical protein PAECIP111890_04374 [Paenibacillus sp. JJ-223]